MLAAAVQVVCLITSFETTTNGYAVLQDCATRPPGTICTTVVFTVADPGGSMDSMELPFHTKALLIM